MEYSYKPHGVCSVKIAFDLEEGNVKNIRFVGGCDGNLKAISKLADGMPAAKLIELLEGNTCGIKPTSCADQFARALKEATAKQDG